MSSKPFKPTLPEASLVEWILGDPEKRFAIHYSNTGGIHLCERTKQNADGRWEFRRISGADPSPEDKPVVERFGGKLMFNPHNLNLAGLVEVLPAATSWPDVRKRFDEVAAGLFRQRSWQYDSSIVILTPAAATWWEEKGRAAQEKFLAKRAAKKAEMAAKERVGVFGGRAKFYGDKYQGKYADGVGRVLELIGKAASVAPQWSGVRVAFSAVITRETATRYYLRDIVNLTSANLRPDGGYGSNVEQYIEKKFLILDNATPEDIARLVEFDKGINADYTAVREKLIDDLIPALLATYERSEQKAAEIDGTFFDLLDTLKKGK
jgi:hypothetical protein